MTELMRLTGNMGIFVTIISLGLGVLLLFLLKILFSFYKDKKISPLYILLGILTGFLWGEIAQSIVILLTLPMASYTPIGIYLPIVAGILLVIMCKLPKTTLFKILFALLVGIFILSPVITPFLFRDEMMVK